MKDYKGGVENLIYCLDGANSISKKCIFTNGRRKRLMMYDVLTTSCNCKENNFNLCVNFDSMHQDYLCNMITEQLLYNLF